MTHSVEQIALVRGKGGGWGGTSFATCGQQTTSQLCDRFPCLSLQPPKVGKSNLVSWGGGREAFPGQDGGQAVRLPIRQGATIGQEIRQQIMPTVVDHCSYFLGLIMQQSIVNIRSGKERSFSQYLFLLEIHFQKSSFLR